MEIQQENVKDFHQNDVLCGKGNSVNRHVGNIQLRTIVSELKYEYVATPRKEKQVFSKMIVKKIRSMNPPGRFLMKDESTGLWNDIGDAGPKGAWSKTRMVLREGAPELQKKIDAGEIKVTTNFLAEMDPKEREEMANEVVRRNRKKGVKKKEKAEHAPKDAPIMVEQTIQPVPFTVPESNEANFLMKVENNLPFNKEHNPNNTPDPATSTMPNAMLPPEPLMMSSSNIQRNSPVQLHKTFNPFNTPDPEISSEPNTMAPPEPITNIKLHRNSLYLSEIDEDFVAVMEGDSDLCYENSEESYFSELEDDEPAVVGPAAPNGVGASSLMHNLKESIMLTPTRDQTEKRPSLNSKGDSLNSKGDSLISKSMANSTLNSTSLSLSGGSGMSIQSSENTITSSKMSLMQKSIMSASIMSASSLGSFHSMSIDPKEREEMANEVVRRNRKKGVKKKEKAEHAPKDAPIMVEQTIQPVPFTVPESNEANSLMKVENYLPFNKEHNPNNTPDPATSTMPNAMLPPEPLMMSSSNIQRNSPVQLHKTFNPFNTPDPEISSEPNTMAPPEPITNIKLHRNSLYLSEIDEDFVAVMEGDSDLCYENSEESYFSELEDDEPAVVGPAAPNGVGASSFMHNLKESIMLTPTRDQTEKRPSLNSKGDSLNSKGDSLISKSMANSTLNSTSLSLSGGSGMSIQSSENTITSSKMSLMQKSIMSASSLGSFHSMSIDPKEREEMA
eukprot:CAMPEP_0194096818 /NCGR_PEP_ID=MMETSP0149-20130528/57543_1 /TAXON_ID=122233 /ORGANISM="Chaetoceros debilis, Strain MM31A-1" /LENGTH=729 /DNA_ID=CAMNT_0038782815 /DNA_START=234 /DNA_END=2420 /DNA_ORIENTATION=+